MYQSQQKGSLEGAVKDLGADIKGTAKDAEAQTVSETKKVKAEL